MWPRNRALDPGGLESPNPIFRTLILFLASFSQTVCQPLLIPTCCAGCSIPGMVERSVGSVSSPHTCPREVLLSSFGCVILTVFHSCHDNVEHTTLFWQARFFLVPLRCRENTPCAGLEDEVQVCSLLTRDDLPEGEHSSDLTCCPLAFYAL